MSDLVQRLCEGDHPVEVSIRPEKTIAALKDCIARGYVHLKFTDTRGGTELGVRLDNELTDLSCADLDRESGTIKFVGGLKLDYVKVRCIAEIGLPDFSGKGHLEVVTA